MIIDSTVIISLGLVGKLDLIEEGIIPRMVLNEIQTESIRISLKEPKFNISTPSDKSKRQALEILGDSMETGDSDIVASLLDFPQSLIATDDKRLRSVCRALGGKITGTLGILIHSARIGKISKDKALEILKYLNNTGFRMSLELYEEVQKNLNEIP
ncbi:MAG: DUF3368 domain-containing protein [Candidatus Helarchaeota archaeon]|nr:DUF3368 domain-containing protein [Candidatus Helarchaeota archaeon]